MLSIYALTLLATTALAKYSIVDDYTTGSFADKFNFFTDNDPTNGYVNYVDYGTAQSSGLYSQSNETVYIGVDHNNTATGRGRNSVRIESKKSYQHGLIILDLAHMPGGACGTWPAFWLLSTSAQWPNGGEVDIIEGVNSQNHNRMAVHTNAGCSISNTGGMSGQIVTSDCNIAAPNQDANQGCATTTSNTDTYGAGFNSNGGGVYATEWTSDGISIWFFPRNAIPSDLTSGNPDPSGWGLPLSRFAGACDWDEKVVNQQIIFDVTFCGQWAGGVFGSDATCSPKASTCQSYVQNNPTAFADTYWSVKSLQVFQQNGQASSTSTTRVVTSTTQTVTTTLVTSTITPPLTTTIATTTIPTTTISTTKVPTTTLTTTTTPNLTTNAPSATSLITSSITSTQIQTSSATTSSIAITSSITTPMITTTHTTPYISTFTTPTTTAIPSSATYTPPNSSWGSWPNTFYTVTRPGGDWPGNGGPPGGSGPGGSGGSGGWGGHPGASRPTWR